MAKRKRKKRGAEDVQDENEFLKLKMMAEFGGNFVGSDDIPPEVENQFLKQIMAFHNQQEGAPKVSIYKFIGEPEYDHVHDLSDKEVKRELKKMKRLLKKHGVHLEVLAPTPDREVYRFITEELFKEEVNDVKIKGWNSQYVYEDYYPNAEYEIKNAAHNILLGLFDKNAQLFEEYIAEDIKDRLGLTTDLEELNSKVDSFKGQYHDVILVDYDFLTVEFDKTQGTAYVQVDVTFKTQKQAGRRTARHLTTVELYLRRDNMVKSMWMLQRLVSDYF